MCTKKTENNVGRSLVVGCLKAVVAKMNGFKNSPMATEVFNFLRVLEASNIIFDFVSVNFVGPAVCSMQRINVVHREKRFIEYDLDSIKKNF